MTTLWFDLEQTLIVDKVEDCEMKFKNCEIIMRNV